MGWARRPHGHGEAAAAHALVMGPVPAVEAIARLAADDIWAGPEEGDELHGHRSLLMARACPGPRRVACGHLPPRYPPPIYVSAVTSSRSAAWTYTRCLGQA